MTVVLKYGKCFAGAGHWLLNHDCGGKGPWRFKSKPHPAIVLIGTVPNSNSFAALQCSENDTPSDPSDGGEKNDAFNNAEPDLGPTMNGVETDLRISNPSVLERVNWSESTRENEDDGHVSSGSVLRSLNSDTTLPDAEAVASHPLPNAIKSCISYTDLKNSMRKSRWHLHPEWHSAGTVLNCSPPAELKSSAGNGPI
ncbi:hypothetical protein Nepgr_032266 [Nepenthes gracilis]|uniref:Uncharacterized protein n=1 Tax=Nepenthes gracilis TaxID=150966 RepID=A0AAD3TIA2_NEPGR|nr:hypothetical protein Nepgr_032266 [Nepenthes gracilis]